MENQNVNQEVQEQKEKLTPEQNKMVEALTYLQANFTTEMAQKVEETVNNYMVSEQFKNELTTKGVPSEIVDAIQFLESYSESADEEEEVTED